MQSKIMILGAGPGQMPLIRTAVELGFYVITVDNLPDNVGHKLANWSVNCSTVDLACVLAAAAELQIDGIATFASDVATQSVGYVANQLGLAGCSLLVAQTMSNKAKFRAFQRQHAGVLNSPGFASGDSMPAIADDVVVLTPPLLFKPVDTSGSRGIVRVDSEDWEQYQSAFDYAQSFSRSKVVCVEEYIEGEDVSGDGFMVDGKLSAVITHKRKRQFVPIGHSLPTHLSPEDQERVLAEVAAHCHALGYHDGPLDFDVRVAPGRVVVLEMSPRLGGNGIPMIIHRATGVDLMAATLRFAIGQRVELPAQLAITRSCGSWIFGSTSAGQIVSVADKPTMQAAVPEVFEYVVHCQIGDMVPSFVHSGNSLGYVLFDNPPGCNYSEMIERVERTLQLVVTPSGAH